MTSLPVFHGSQYQVAEGLPKRQGSGQTGAWKTTGLSHVCDDEGRAAAGGGRGVPREQDELDPGPHHVRELLCALLQALRRQLLPEAEEPEAAADCPGSRALHEPL